MGRRYLSEETISEVFEASLACGFYGDSLPALLSKLDDAVAASLLGRGTDLDQLFHALNTLNKRPPDADGEVAFEKVLAAAVQLAGGRVEARVFADARTAVLAGAGAVASAPKSPASASVDSDSEEELTDEELDLREQLEELLLAREARLREDPAADTSALVAEMIAVKRRMRSGRELQPGGLIADGRFRLLQPIGSGGYATVWKALDRSSQRVVAIKVLHGQHARDATARERFFRGAERMAQLEHPHVVRVLVHEGEETDGHGHRWFFFVMEYLPGGDLRSAAAKQPRTLEENIAIVEQVASALTAAHKRGMVHRDVSPDNVLLAADGTVRLTDFDLVHADDSTGGTRTTGLGKYLYAAPEAMVSANKVDATADVYSLAMVTIFLLRGRPLDGGVVRNLEACINHLPCSHRMREVLNKATSVDPRRRPESVVAFTTALRDSVNRTSGEFVLEKVVGFLGRVEPPFPVGPAVRLAAALPRRAAVVLGGLALVGLGAVLVFKLLGPSGSSGIISPNADAGVDVPTQARADVVPDQLVPPDVPTPPASTNPTPTPTGRPARGTVWFLGPDSLRNAPTGAGVVIGANEILTLGYVVQTSRSGGVVRLQTSEGQLRTVLSVRPEPVSTDNSHPLVVVGLDRAAGTRSTLALSPPNVGEVVSALGVGPSVSGTVVAVSASELLVRFPQRMAGYGGGPVLNATGKVVALLSHRVGEFTVDHCLRVDRATEPSEGHALIPSTAYDP